MEIKQKIRSQSVKTKKATRIKERGDIAVKSAKISVKTIRRGIRGASVAAQKGKLIAQKANGYGSVHESANETEYAVTYLKKASCQQSYSILSPRIRCVSNSKISATRA